MSKIKINLASGAAVEKPLVTCFKGTNGNYLILDNETNGQMGYPVICISKINGTTVEKINDQSEWASVKENLKTIISGTALPYLTVGELLTGEDDFYTQLTLPVASFDLLKEVYKPEEVETPAVPETPIEIETPVEANEEVTENVTPEPAVIAPDVPVSNEPATEEISAPVIEETTETEVAPVTEVETPESEVEVNATNDDISALKETFMKSCENMFDALVQKFNNK